MVISLPLGVPLHDRGGRAIPVQRCVVGIFLETVLEVGADDEQEEAEANGG